MTPVPSFNLARMIHWLLSSFSLKSFYEVVSLQTGHPQTSKLNNLTDTVTYISPNKIFLAMISKVGETQASLFPSPEK